MLCSPEAGDSAIRTLFQDLKIRIPESLFILEDRRFVTRHLLRPTVHICVQDHVQDRFMLDVGYIIYRGEGFGLDANGTTCTSSSSAQVFARRQYHQIFRAGTINCRCWNTCTDHRDTVNNICTSWKMACWYRHSQSLVCLVYRLQRSITVTYASFEPLKLVN